MKEQLAQCAIDAALKAGDILREGYGTNFVISNKEGKNNLVTEYDKRSEEFIINFIKDKFPDHSFLAEESGVTGKENSDKIHWIIDPLDGTVNFAHALPIFAVSIAAELNNELLCGVIYNPMTNELFSAVKGQGAMLNGNSIHVSDSTELDKSFLVTGFPYDVDRNPGKCVDHFIAMIKQGIPVRRLGSAALDLAYVAVGRFDGFWEINLKPWDVAAGVLIVREAGGLVTQYDNSQYWINDKTLLATNGLIHKSMSNTLLSCFHQVTGD